MDSEPRPAGQFGLASLLLLVAIPAMGIIGGQFGYRWGVWQAALGAVVGAVLAIPLCGIFFTLMLGVAWLGERLFPRKTK